MAKQRPPCRPCWQTASSLGWFSTISARILDSLRSSPRALVGESGKVFSFEPDPENAARLRRNIQRNGFKIHPLESGVWSSTGTFHFVTSDSQTPDHGMGRFVENGAELSGSLVACVSLDDFTHTARPPDAIKCDVEGAEVEVLRGADKLLQSSRRPWIIMETHSPAYDQAARGIFDRLGTRSPPRTTCTCWLSP